MSIPALTHHKAPMFRHPVDPSCIINCFPDLCLSQTVTRRLWHKNTDNWSTLDSQRSHQLFLLWKLSKERATIQIHREMRSQAATLFCFYIYFLSASSFLSFRLEMSLDKTCWEKCVVSQSAQTESNHFARLYDSQVFVCVSVHVQYMCVHVFLCLSTVTPCQCLFTHMTCQQRHTVCQTGTKLQDF